MSLARPDTWPSIKSVTPLFLSNLTFIERHTNRQGQGQRDKDKDKDRQTDRLTGSRADEQAGRQPGR